MRRTITILTAVVLFGGLLAPPALAHPRHSTVYLSMGTSLAAGSLADSEGNTTATSSRSYTDELYKRARDRFGRHLQHVKLGCVGETTDQLLGDANVFGEPSNCVDDYETGSQIDDALATIAERDVSFITIDIGANDILQVQQVCEGDPGCIGSAIPQIAGNVAEIVGTLRGAGYNGPILAMNYYNPQVAAAIGFFPGVAGQQDPDLQLATASDVLAQGFNGALEQVFAAYDVAIVDVYSVFNSGDFGDDRPANGRPDNVDVLCALSYMCPRDDNVKANIHLNRRGYMVVARQFLTKLALIESTA
jgi:lysophospholipase L1-like esterase